LRLLAFLIHFENLQAQFDLLRRVVLLEGEELHIGRHSTSLKPI
jgi:hypothetical protein